MKFLTPVGKLYCGLNIWAEDKIRILIVRVYTMCS